MEARSNPVVKLLDGAFLWLPNDRSPGFAAVGLFLLRQVTLPLLLLMGPMILLLVMSRTGPGQILNPAGLPGWLVIVIPTAMFGCIALVQELSRYAFVRHAERPVRSLLIFTGVVIAAILLFEHDRLYTPAWMIAAQLAASGALFYGMRARVGIPLVLAAIIVGQTIVDVTAPRLFLAPEAPEGATKPAAAASAEPPAVGSMKTWAQVYPGATVTSSRTDTMFGLTSWTVDYRAAASPDKILAFYQSIAQAQGFKDEGGFGGFHIYKRESTGDDFTFGAVSQGRGSLVSYKARASGG